VVDGGHGMPVVALPPATFPLPEGRPDVDLGAEGLPGRQFGSRPEPGVEGETPLVPVPAATGRLHRRRPVAIADAISFIMPSLVASEGSNADASERLSVLSPGWR
jgi:hypothetical protein